MPTRSISRVSRFFNDDRPYRSRTLVADSCMKYCAHPDSSIMIRTAVRHVAEIWTPPFTYADSKAPLPAKRQKYVQNIFARMLTTTRTKVVRDETWQVEPCISPYVRFFSVRKYDLFFNFFCAICRRPIDQFFCLHPIEFVYQFAPPSVAPAPDILEPNWYFVIGSVSYAIITKQ